MSSKIVKNNRQKWIYHKSAIITLLNGNKESYVTELYQTGIYVILNDSPASQFSTTPKELEKLCKSIKKDLNEKKILNVEWGPEITVERLDSLYKEVIN